MRAGERPKIDQRRPTPRARYSVSLPRSHVCVYPIYIYIYIYKYIYTTRARESCDLYTRGAGSSSTMGAAAACYIFRKNRRVERDDCNYSHFGVVGHDAQLLLVLLEIFRCPPVWRVRGTGSFWVIIGRGEEDDGNIAAAPQQRRRKLSFLFCYLFQRSCCCCSFPLFIPRFCSDVITFILREL